MDEQNIPQTQKSSPSSIQNQDAAHSFFYASGVVHHDYLPEGSTVNQTYYNEVLKRLRDAIRRKRPKLRRSGDWFFHHDNAPALRTREFLAKHSITVLPHPHPPYSPDLAQCDFFLFPMLKRPLKGRRFETILETNANATKGLKGIKKEAYLYCFRKWKHRRDKCVRWEGEYYDGDPDL